MNNDWLTKTLLGVYAFYEHELSEFAIGIWVDAMQGYGGDEITAAFGAHLRDPQAGRFIPKPADIIRQLRGSDDERALIAWGNVLQCAKSGGRTEGLDAVARQTIESMGGMHAIQRSDESQNGFLQKRFVDAFKAYKRREEIEQCNVRQIGMAASTAIKAVR